MEEKHKKGLFSVGKFRFENEQVEKWVNLGTSINTEYEYEVKPTGITPLNHTEGLLKFTFQLELLPDKGKISFNGDCYLFSNNLKAPIMVLKADENSIIRKKNQAFMDKLYKLLLRRCLDHAKNIGEKEGVHFPNYESVLQQWCIEHISFNNTEKKILSLKGDSLIPKQQEEIKNFAGFKDFIFYNEKVIPGDNIGKNHENADFDVNSNLYKPKILSKMSILIQYHFTMKISPEIGLIEFDGQFRMDSFKKEVGYLVKHEKDKLTKILQNIIAKEGINHSEKIGKKYRIGFSAKTVLKNLGIK